MYVRFASILTAHNLGCGSMAHLESYKAPKTLARQSLKRTRERSKRQHTETSSAFTQQGQLQQLRQLITNNIFGNQHQCWQYCLLHRDLVVTDQDEQQALQPLSGMHEHTGILMCKDMTCMPSQHHSANRKSATW